MDPVIKQMRMHTKWWAGALLVLAIIGLIFPWGSDGCSDKEIQARVLSFVKSHAVEAMAKSDNLVMRETSKNIATAGVLGNIFSALNPKNPTSQATTQLGKTPDVKLAFNSITETAGDGTNHSCQASIQIDVPAVAGMQPQKGSVSLSYRIQPNLADRSKGPVINVYW